MVWFVIQLGAAGSIIVEQWQCVFPVWHNEECRSDSGAVFWTWPPNTQVPAPEQPWYVMPVGSWILLGVAGVE